MIDELLMHDPTMLHILEKATKLLKAARLEQLSIDARHRALQYAHALASYQVHMYCEQLSRTDIDLTNINTAVKRLQVSIERSGVVLDLEDIDKDIYRVADTGSSYVSEAGTDVA